jgi:hypothetical protein
MVRDAAGDGFRAQRRVVDLQAFAHRDARGQIPTRHRFAQTSCADDLAVALALRRADALLVSCGVALQPHEQKLAAASFHSVDHLLHESVVFWGSVDQGEDDAGQTRFRRGLESGQANPLGELAERRRRKVKQRPDQVEGQVVVEELEAGQLRERACRGQLADAGGDRKGLPASCAAGELRLVVDPAVLAAGAAVALRGAALVQYAVTRNGEGEPAPRARAGDRADRLRRTDRLRDP